jgi:hypothetical protein
VEKKQTFLHHRGLEGTQRGHRVTFGADGDDSTHRRHVSSGIGRFLGQEKQFW